MKKNCAVVIVLVILMVSLGAMTALALFEIHSQEPYEHVGKFTSRKLKEYHGFHPPSVRTEARGQTVAIDDYGSIDPVPTSKTSVNHGPIEHGSHFTASYLPPVYPPSP